MIMGTNGGRTFDLFAKLRMKKDDLKTNPDAEDGSVIPYYMKNGDAASGSIEPWCYNSITLWGGNYNQILAQSTDDDPFQMATDGSIPRKYETFRKYLEIAVAADRMFSP
jgi:hypothetical protein